MNSKIALVTGASGDIGYKICETLARDGFNIVFHYNKSNCEQKIEALSKLTQVLPIQADLLKKNEIEDLINKIKLTFGKLDVIVNNAGVDLYAPLIDNSYEEILNTTLINQIAPIYLTKLALPLLSSNSSIVNISSIWGVLGGSCESVYSASKAGLIGFTKALSKEIGTMNIRVNAVVPGLIDTKMNSNLSKKDIKNFIVENCSIQRIGKPEDIANIVKFLVCDDSSYITGQVFPVDGGII